MTRKLKRLSCLAITVCCLIICLILLIEGNIESIGGTNLDDISGQNQRDYVIDEHHKLGAEFWQRENVKPQHKQIGSRNNLNVFRPLHPDLVKVKTAKVKLKTFRGETPIFVYSASLDSMISSYVKDYGTWEEDLLKQTAQLLLKYPDITFIDLGCNVGVYTLFMADLGIDVVAVDALRINLQLLSMSLSAGRFHSNTTLVYNAISNEYRNVQIKVPDDNIGGAHVVGPSSPQLPAYESDLIPTIMVDDLTPLIKGRNVGIKMDIEGHEMNALQGAKTFFQTFDVKFLLMEFVQHRFRDSGQVIVNILVRNGFMPYDSAREHTLLDLNSYHRWPENVFWIKR